MHAVFAVVRGMLASIKALPLKAAAWVFRRRFAVGIASLIWLLWRTGLRPNRIAYPCQQVAAANVAAMLGGTAIIGLLTSRWWVPLLRRRVLVAVASVIVCTIVSLTGYEILAERAVSGVSAIIPQTHLADQASYPAAALAGRVMYPSADDAVVAVKRNAAITYGSTSPYDKASNPAYDHVWNAVAELHLGPADNPVRDFVQPGNTVIIKPNTESTDCTHAAVLRPLIDMCLLAGAARVNIGDCSGCGYTQSSLDGLGYTDMVSTLRMRGKQVYAVTFGIDSAWSWINLGADSAYAGTSYTDASLTARGAASPYFMQTDSHGRNPNGHMLKWNATTDYILGADVVINVPKLKVHDALVGTFGIKNWVGAALHSTTNAAGDCATNFARVTHWGPSASTNWDYSFGNDFMWRELADLHRATIYWKNGVLNATPQRKYLVVLDGIVGVDHRQHVGSGGVQMQMGIVAASTNVVAADAVIHRLVKWDFRKNPLVNNAPSVPSHPFGTNDPAKIRVVGDPIDASVGTLFTSDNFTSYAEFNAMKLTDLTPPVINSVTETWTGSRLDIAVQTDSDAAVVFLYYGDDGSGTNSRNAVRMAKNGTSFTRSVIGSTMTCKVVAQDRFFNTRSSGDRQVTFVPNPDCNGDCKVNILDLIYVRNQLNKDPLSGDDAAKADINGDAAINILDLIYVRNKLNTRCP